MRKSNINEISSPEGDEPSMACESVVGGIGVSGKEVKTRGGRRVHDYYSYN